MNSFIFHVVDCEFLCGCSFDRSRPFIHLDPYNERIANSHEKCEMRNCERNEEEGKSLGLFGIHV